MKILLTLFAASVLVFGTAQALPPSYEGEPPETMQPLTSLARLTAYALDNVKFGMKSAWSQYFVSHPDNSTSFFVQGAGTFDTVTQLNNAEFRFKSYRPQMPLFVHGLLLNERFNALFSMSANATTQQTGPNSYVIMCQPLQMRLASRVPVKFPNAVSARMEYTDPETGEQAWYYFQVENGYIFVPPDLFQSGYRMGPIMIVQTYYPDGGPAISPGESFETVYDLAVTGRKLDTYVVRGAPSLAVENCVIGTDKNMTPGTSLHLNLMAKAPAHNGWEIVNPPTAQVRITAPQGTKRAVTFTVVVPENVEQIDMVEIVAYDQASIQPDGSFIEYAASTTAGLNWSKSTVGGVTSTTLSATFLMEGEESDWTIHATILNYEKQRFPWRYSNQGTPSTPAG